MLKSTPNVRKSPRSGLNLGRRLSNPQIFQGPAGLAVKAARLACGERGFDSHRSHARRGASTVGPWGRAQIHPECPQEPQIRLESGGEAERSPHFPEEPQIRLESGAEAERSPNSHGGFLSDPFGDRKKPVCCLPQSMHPSSFSNFD